ncbi:MAG: dTDP-4-dehydrorhamnose reductase [Hyphomicrobiales bacterium]|nr:dTDP-4-dehydrorhamnose reductase [Hyphomicrobiales bacterium]
MKLLLTGRDGRIGSELARALAPLGTMIAVGRSDCDLADGDALRGFVRAAEPEIIVNAAAYTAVDRAESEPEQAATVNAVAPGILGEEAKRLGSLVVHYSTDFVFDGLKAEPYTEVDRPNPLSVYGRTKLEGERALAAGHGRHLIFRTSWVYCSRGGSFIATILDRARARASLDVVADQNGAPTAAGFIADVTAKAIAAELQGRLAAGIYHLTATGSTSRYDLARHVVARARRNGARFALAEDGLRPVASGDYPAPAQRPLNSRLDTSRLSAALSERFPDWRVDVDRFVDELTIESAHS